MEFINHLIGCDKILDFPEIKFIEVSPEQDFLIIVTNGEFSDFLIIL